MSIPGLNEPFHEFYDQYSIRGDRLVIPDHFDFYHPDNQDDYSCIAVICPSRTKGAQRWTYKGRCLTIGIYRDEGRETAKRTVRTISWARTGKTLKITDPRKHNLNAGDLIDLWNINVESMYNVKVESVFDEYSFFIQGHLVGSSTGASGSYQPQAEIDFYQDYRVFRILPSFKLITVAELYEIFDLTAPSISTSSRTIYNITTSKDVQVPNVKTLSTNYELPTKSVAKDEILPLARRFDQVYDEDGNPLELNYRDDGMVVPTDNVDSKFKNEHRYLANSNGDQSKIYVYDYYGIELNDVNRGPHHSTDVVVRDTTTSKIIGNLSVKKDNNGDPVYSRTLNDEFGNLAIGVQLNNALVVRKQVLPLSLDSFNRPVKKPYK